MLLFLIPDDRFSQSPLTGIPYEVPLLAKAPAAVEEFLSRNEGNRLSWFRVGFCRFGHELGLRECNQCEYAVVESTPSRDSFWKIVLLLFLLVQLIRKFRFENAIRQGNHMATFDPFVAVPRVIVGVNLDISKHSGEEGKTLDFDVDLGAFEKAIRTIADHCKPDVLIVVETTVPPGTCENVVLPILKSGLSGRNLDSDFSGLAILMSGLCGA